MGHPAIITLLLVVSAVLFFLFWPPPQIVIQDPPPITTRLLEQGEYLVKAGGCLGCHTAEGGQVLAGGRALESPVGTFYTPNITPDPQTGIGNWSDGAFVRALQYGANPRGVHYYPAFPYTAYTGLDQRSLLAMKAYLFSLEPVHQPNRDHELAWYANFRAGLRPWKLLNFQAQRFETDPARGRNWNRGALLARHLGHCAECHSPRNWMGGIIDDYRYAGNPDGLGNGLGNGPVPNITPHEQGIAEWSLNDLELFLELGMDPSGDFVGGEMAMVIEASTSQLPAEDRRAIGEYLLSLPPRQAPQ